MSAIHTKLLREAFDAYLVQLNSVGLTPQAPYLSYDFDYLDHFKWQMFGGEMVKDELRELTNLLNHWHGNLLRWHTWNQVIETYDNEDDAWNLRWEFLEALAYQCLLQPSAIRDTITFIVTNSMHQVRLAIGNGYRDYLDGDQKTAKEKPKHLKRSQKETRLANLTSPWPESVECMSLLRKIDDEVYRKITSDYRNRSSHAIGPRLGTGYTRTIVRTISPAEIMTEQADSTFKLTLVPEKMSVRYEIGGTPPLDMEAARVANLEQYSLARSCYQQYLKLLAAGMTSMPPPSSVR